MLPDDLFREGFARGFAWAALLVVVVAALVGLLRSWRGLEADVAALKDQTQPLPTLSERLKEMSQAFEALKAQVQAATDAVEQAVVTIQTLATRLKDSPNDPALATLTDQLKASAEKLTTAVAQNPL